jgi:hypothetical protein
MSTELATTGYKLDGKKGTMIEALSRSLGIVTNACKAINISRQTHYDWMKDDPEYAAAVQEIDNLALDFAESRLYKLIQKGDTSATIFYLKTKGKKRGYQEGPIVDVKTNGNTQIIFDFGKQD